MDLLKTELETEKMKTKSQEPQQTEKITLILDSNRRKITPPLREKHRTKQITEHQTIFTLQELTEELEANRLHINPEENNTTIIGLGTNDIKEPDYKKAIGNIQTIKKNTNKDNTIFINIKHTHTWTQGMTNSTRKSRPQER